MNKVKGAPSSFLDAVETVLFKAVKVSNPECVWNSELVDLDDIESNAYIVKKDNEFFANVDCDDSKQLLLFAERYGGYGVGTNGGGGRCGNNGAFQLKGIGVTPCVGKGENLYCTSGMYPLYEAITEATNYRIYSYILPVGLINVHGINFIGSSSYYVTAEESSTKQSGETKLAILVREKCTRIGHFLAARNFEPLEQYKSVLFNDTLRTRKVSKALNSLLEDNEDFINLVLNLLSNSAQQFAFANIYRISHGALTPSNLSLDGRWLDLTNLTFVPCGFDYRAGSANPQFLQEPKALINIVVEFLDTYCKFNQININIKPLINFFYKEYNRYRAFYVTEIFGVTQDCNDFENYHNELVCLSNAYLRIMRRNPVGISGVPRMLDLVEGEELDFILNHFRAVNSSLYNNSDSIIAFSKLFSLWFSKTGGCKSSVENFKMYLSIKALRKLIYMPFFYIGRIYLSSRELVKIFDNINYKMVGDFINSYGFYAKWIFGGEDSSFITYIYSSKNIKILYDFNINQFIYIKNENAVTFSGIDDLLSTVVQEPSSVFSINFFDFQPHIIHLLNKLKIIDSRSNGK